MKTIKLYMINRRVRKFYYTTELPCCKRLSNNAEPKFTDIEATVIYLYGMNLGFPTKKSIYKFAKEHLLRYCKHLPSYKQFCLRINKLAPVFAELCNLELTLKRKTSKTHLVDSMPVVVARLNEVQYGAAVIEQRQRRSYATKVIAHRKKCGITELKFTFWQKNANILFLFRERF